MISVESLSFAYAGRTEAVLRNLSFGCESGGIVVVLGRSGVGKSTLLALVSGMYTGADRLTGAYEGSIDVDGLRPEQLQGPEVISWVPQAPMLFEHLSVLDNIVLPTSIGGRSRSFDAHIAAMNLLEAVGLADKGGCRPRELSGGMLTRASLLRALISKPRYLLLDEPFNGLDLVTRWRIYELIRLERAATSFTTLLTTHDIMEATVLADRIVLLEETERGTSATIVPNVPVTGGAFKVGVGLAQARAAASAIESRLFQHDV